MENTNKWVQTIKNILFANGVICDSEQFLTEDILDLITQTQQETLEWCLKEIGEEYEQGTTVVQFKDGTSLLFTNQESLYDINTFIKYLKLTIKKKMGGKE